jgi:hypothetical protein
VIVRSTASSKSDSDPSTAQRRVFVRWLIDLDVRRARGPVTSGIEPANVRREHNRFRHLSLVTVSLIVTGDP